jgi:hypothetical protein
MDRIAALQEYLGLTDHKGRLINVRADLLDASDRTRPFYVEMAKEMRQYLTSQYPELDFKRKTGLNTVEFERRLRMLGIERPALGADSDVG